MMLAACAASLPAQVSATTPSTMAVHHVDVGQGGAAILEFSCGVVMVDAGGQGATDGPKLVSYLDALFTRRTDLKRTIATIFVTHNHKDHTVSLDNVVAAFTVKSIVETGLYGASGDPGDAAYRVIDKLPPAKRPPHVIVDENDIQPKLGLTNDAIDPVDCQGTDPIITVLSTHPHMNPGWPAADWRDKNNSSLVIRVDFGKASYLFTGDLEAPAIEHLLALHAGSPLLDADVYVVGHHGSANGTTLPLLQALIKPKIAILTSGPCDRMDGGNFNGFKFGHPRTDIVRMLIAAVARPRTPSKRVWVADGQEDFHQITMKKAIYATGWDGNIVVEATKAGAYAVSYDRPSAPASCG